MLGRATCQYAAVHIIIRGVGMAAVAVAAEILIAWFVPGGETNAAAGLLTLGMLAVVAVVWARHDVTVKSRRWKVGPSWALVGALAAVISIALAQLHAPGDLVATIIGIGFTMVLGVVVPATITAGVMQEPQL